jgi:periplasmic divalent cation tolerance protein
MTTVENAGEAESLARLIVEAKLAACVQILPRMTSVYFWEGKLHAESEHLLLIKTLEEKFDELSGFIKQNHSYEVPEIVAVNAERVSEDYLNWIRDVTSQNRER